MLKFRTSHTIVRPPAERSTVWLACLGLLGVLTACVLVSRPTAVIAQVNAPWGIQGPAGHELMSQYLATALVQHHKAGQSVEAFEIGKLLQQYYADTPSGERAVTLLPALDKLAQRAQSQASWYYEKVDGEGFGAVVVTQTRSQGEASRAWTLLLRKTSVPRLDGVFLVLPDALPTPCEQACIVRAQFQDAQTSFRLEPVEGHPGQWEFLDREGLVSKLRTTSRLTLTFEGGASAQFDVTGWSPDRSGWPSPSPGP